MHVFRKVGLLLFSAVIAVAFTAVFASPALSVDTSNHDYDGCPILFPQNWSEFNLAAGEKELGTISAYTDTRGTFLRIDSILKLLVLPYEKEETSDLIKIKSSDNIVITLNVGKHEYTENANRHSMYYNDAFSSDGKTFVNVTLLNRILLPKQLIVDSAARTISVIDKGCGVLGLGIWCKDQKDIAPPPLAAPVQPVIVDDLSGKPAISSPPAQTVATEGTDVLHITQAEEPPPTTGEEPKTAEPEPSQETAGGSLILQPRIKDLPPTEEFIEALDLPGQIFLPLNDTVQILEFPIKIEDNGNIAKGFFFSPDNDFYLNVEKREARVGTRHWDISRKDIRRKDGQIYISSESFAEWFGIETGIDRTNSTIRFTTDKKFPREAQEDRQKKWQKLMKFLEKDDSDYPVLQNPYKLISVPVIDVNAGTSYSHDETSSSASSNSDQFVSNYNIQGSMDIGYLNSQFYLQGSTDRQIFNNARFTAGRKDPGGDLLGGLHATEFSIGDVLSPSLTMVTTNSLGRGFSFSNKNLNASENFDVRSFSGDSTPGYEAELYRNDVLISFQTVDSNGRYSFTDIPILYGNNTFRIVLYGPQGQREERVETVSAFSALLKENKFEYTFGLNQKSLDLIPINKSSSSTTSDTDGFQAVSGFRYGITRDLTVGAGMASTRLDNGEEHQYATAMTGANLWGVLAETNFAKDVAGGWAGGVTALGGLEGISLRAKYRKYNDFASEAINNDDTPLSSEASLDANTQAYLPLFGDFSLGISTLRETFEDKNRSDAYTNGIRISKGIWGISFTNAVDYIVDEDKRFQDTFGIQTRVEGVELRAVGVYDIKPQQQFRNARFVADYKLTDKLSAVTQVDKYLDSDSRTSLTQNLSWDFDLFRLGINGQMSNDGEYSIGTNIIFSINRNGLSNRWQTQSRQISTGGAIAGRVYVDENNNNKLDEGEKILPDVKVKVNKAAATLGPDGYFMAPVSPYELARVELDAYNSPDDPLLTPKVKGYKVLTRPGDTVVADFPLVQTTIIDGSVLFLDDNGNKRELGNMVVELEDKDGNPLKRTMSALDGYYNFDKVQTGEYWITVPEEALSAINAIIREKVHLVIKEVSEFITEKDIVLQQRAKLDGPPSFEEAEPVAIKEDAPQTNK